MMLIKSAVLVQLVVILNLLRNEIVVADGTVSVKFIHYENPDGKAANGHCCDGKWSVCQSSGCDYLFTICLDDGTGAESMDQCEYGSKEAARVKNRASYDFGITFGGLDNPMLFPFTGSLSVYLVLKIDVYDKDLPYTNNDFVDFLRVTIPVFSNAGTSGALQDFQAYGSRDEDRTSLTGQIQVNCDPNWYNEVCGQFCAPPGGQDNYWCDRTTGQKVCYPGWEGHDCDIPDVPTTPPTTAPPTTTTRRTTTRTTPTTPRPTTRATTTAPRTTTDAGVIFVNRPNADCDNLANNGYRYQDGVYTLQVANYDPFLAYCDMSSEGWTLIQQRTDGVLSFDRGWDEYVEGFGQVGAVSEFWLGLEKIYWLTNQRPCKLRITMMIGNREFRFAEYEHFWIDSERENFALHVDGFSGSAGDALSFTGLEGARFHNGQPFSTADRDNDQWEGDNCGQIYQSGWWFNDCYYANLNGVYLRQTNGWPECGDGRSGCLLWNTIKGYENYSLIKTEMRIMPISNY